MSCARLSSDLGQKLAFPDEHFDAYYACHVVHITTNPDVMLREVRLVLRAL